MIKDYDYLLDTVGESLQITEIQYEKLKQHYTALCKHICDNHILSEEGGNIYQQGSFATDTVIKPLRGDEYDVDIVAEFDVSWKPQHKVSDFYEKLYNAFKTKMYEDKLETYRNNIRINYKSNYHFDIMPVLPTKDQKILKAPDSKLSKWVDRSPKSYAEWFNNKSQQIIEHGFILNERSYLYKASDMDVDELNKPDNYQKKAPLNRVVQLVKRARDKFFYDYDDDIPQSVVLTTIIAEIYSGESNLNTLLKKVAYHFKSLALSGKKFDVKNPVRQNDENFTDKWKEDNRKFYDNFKKFALWFNYKIMNLESENIVVVRKTLYSLFNVNYDTLHSNYDVLNEYNDILTSRDERLFSGEKIIEDFYDLDLKYDLQINCSVVQDGFPKTLLSNLPILLKERELEFFIKSTNVVGDYNVYWKVRNIGLKAEEKGQIRGFINLKKSELKKEERSNFKGPHFVECYIVQNNKVVAIDRMDVSIR